MLDSGATILSKLNQNSYTFDFEILLCLKSMKCNIQYLRKRRLPTNDRLLSESFSFILIMESPTLRNNETEIEGIFNSIERHISSISYLDMSFLTTHNFIRLTNFVFNGKTYIFMKALVISLKTT